MYNFALISGGEILVTSLNSEPWFHRVIVSLGFQTSIKNNIFGERKKTKRQEGKNPVLKRC